MNEIIKHYDLLIAEDNDPVHDPAPLRAYMNKWDGAAFINALGLTHDKSVLEIGVGTGRLALRCAPMCKALTGIDFSPETARRARQNLAHCKNVKIICADFYEYEFQDRYDIIYSSLTFLHFQDKKTAVNKIARLLKPGGKAVLSLDKSQKKELDTGTRKIPLYPDNPDEITELLRESGLEITLKTQTEYAYILAADCPV